MKTVVTSLLIILFVSSASAADKKRAQKRPTPTRTVVYKTVGDAKLSLHVFEPKGHKPSDSRSAIVFFFGGGWVGGSPGQFYPHCDYLASRGMVAMSAEYRVKKVHNTSPFECVKDGKSAVRWIRSNAKKLGVDPKRIAVGGGSAGGHVAACTGTIADINEDDEDLTVNAVPVAMALFNPVIDTGPKGYGHDRLKEKYKLISPVDNVSKGTPPTIIFQGDADTTTPPGGHRRFNELMKKAGNRCELHEYEGQKHGFFNFGRGDGSHYNRTVRAMDEFFASLGLLEGN